MLVDTTPLLVRVKTFGALKERTNPADCCGIEIVVSFISIAAMFSPSIWIHSFHILFLIRLRWLSVHKIPTPDACAKMRIKSYLLAFPWWLCEVRYMSL